MDYRDPESYRRAVQFINNLFGVAKNDLNVARELAADIKRGIQQIDPFIQEATAAVCPQCKEVCCIAKHGYYALEDLVYLRALGIEAPAHDTSTADTEPCPFLSASGCSMERWMRPSGCNWYFCPPLLDYMEIRPEYPTFDDTLKEVAERWLLLCEQIKRP